jgi:hypothetical protein
MKAIFYIILSGICHLSYTQDAFLPYKEIPPAPEHYTAANVTSRMIDGLGFRYYWASKGLRDVDLVFKPSKEARSTEETLRHMYDMSIQIRHVVMQSYDAPEKPNDYAELRKHTLDNLKAASDQLKKYSDDEMNKLVITFGRGNNAQSFPFWHLINGQIADCLTHTGQVISFRRSSGNPVSDKINVFTGEVKD